MGTKIRIANWQERYENNRSRELKALNWVPIPNSLDTLEYVELVTLSNGPALYAAWITMIQIASRQPVRGTIPQEGARIPQALATISRLPAGLFEELLPLLHKWQWIEYVSEIPREGARLSHAGAGIPQEGAQKEGKEVKEGREAAAASTEPEPKNKPKPEAEVSPIDELVHATANELHRMHAAAGFTPGPMRTTEAALVQVLADAVDPPRVAAAILAAHPKFIPGWRERVKQKPSAFVPSPGRWLHDGEYLHPPQTIAAAPVYREFDRSLVPK